MHKSDQEGRYGWTKSRMGSESHDAWTKVVKKAVMNEKNQDQVQRVMMHK